MIEAVKSTLSASSATRNVVAQNSTAKSLSANPAKIQEAAKAPYVSPYIAIDRGSNRAVVQIRDSDTGDVVRQFPTEGQLKAYRTVQEFSDRQEEAIQESSNEGAPSSEGAQDVTTASVRTDA